MRANIITSRRRMAGYRHSRKSRRLSRARPAGGGRAGGARHVIRTCRCDMFIAVIVRSTGADVNGEAARSYVECNVQNSFVCLQRPSAQQLTILISTRSIESASSTSCVFRVRQTLLHSVLLSLFIHKQVHM